VSEGICDFSIDGDCDEPAEEMRCSFVRARVEHRCLECASRIPVGATFERIALKYEGSWNVDRLCLACSEVSQEFYDGGRVLGVLWSEIESNWDDGAHLQACLNRLSTVAAKELMRRQWLQWKGLGDSGPSNQQEQQTR
jgi:hypothetical protein